MTLECTSTQVHMCTVNLKSEIILLQEDPMIPNRFMISASIILFSFVILSCTFGPKPAPSRSVSMEEMLLEAGFVRNSADTPEKLARIRKEIQRKVIPVQDDEETFYIYADADFCQCLYVGDEPAFRRFEGLMYRRNLERNSCIDDRLRSSQAEPWREFGGLGSFCNDRP